MAIVSGMAATAAADACAVTTLVTCPDSPPSTTTTAAPTTNSVPSPVQARAQLLALVNGERVQRGLRPLVARADVEDIASRWSDSMATAGAISHDDAYFTDASHDRLSAALLGENVARAASIEQAHRALMASEHHRDNILDARFTTIGLGTSFHDGSWWITQDFVQPRTPAATVAVKASHVRRAPVATSPPVAVAVTSTTAAPTVAAQAIAAAVPVGVGTVAVLPRVDAARSTAHLPGEPATEPRSAVIGASCLLLALAAQVARRALATA